RPRSPKGTRRQPSIGGSHLLLANAGKLRRDDLRLPPVATVGERVSRRQGGDGHGAGHRNRLIVPRRLAGRPGIPRQLFQMLAQPFDPVPRSRDVLVAALFLAQPLQRVERAAAELIRAEPSLLTGHPRERVARLRTTALL